MKFHILLLICLILFAGSIPAFGEGKIIFAVPRFEPHTFVESDEVQGIGGKSVKEIMDKMGMSYLLKPVPNFARAFKETEAGRADGFFLATRNVERDKIAVFSEPVGINKWSWFFPVDSQMSVQDPGFKSTATIGTALHTNTHIWLKKNGYQHITAIQDFRTLPKLLVNNRVDAVFLSKSVFLHSALEHNISPDQFKIVVQFEKPFGIYISKKYLKKNPGFMEKLNNAIKHTVK